MTYNKALLDPTCVGILGATSLEETLRNDGFFGTAETVSTPTVVSERRYTADEPLREAELMTKFAESNTETMSRQVRKRGESQLHFLTRCYAAGFYGPFTNGE